MAQAVGKPQNILLFGATGTIGKYILAKIIDAKSSFGRIAIFTSPGTVASKSEQIASLKARDVEVIVGDVKVGQEVLRAYEGIDTVISAVGRNVIAEQLNWIRLADQSPSVKRFFPSEFGTDIEYSPASAQEPPHQQKLKVRALIRTLPELEYTYVVTGPYADAQAPAYLSALPSATEMGTFDVKARSAVLLGDGKGKISLTTPPDVGKLVVQALRHPSESRNRALKVNSFTTTPDEILAEFEAQCGGAKWSVTYTSLDELRRLEKEAWESKHPMAPIFTLRRIWTEGGTLYEKRDNDLIGATDLDGLQDAIRDAISVQNSDGQDLYADRKFM